MQLLNRDYRQVSHMAGARMGLDTKFFRKTILKLVAVPFRPSLNASLFKV